MIEKKVYNMTPQNYLSVIRIYNVSVDLTTDMVNEIYQIYKDNYLDIMCNDESFLKIAMATDIMAARGYETADEMQSVVTALGLNNADIDCLTATNSIIALRFNLDLEQSIADANAALKNKKVGKTAMLIYAKAIINYAIASPIFSTIANSITSLIEYVNGCTIDELDAASTILSYMINRMEA